MVPVAVAVEMVAFPGIDRASSKVSSGSSSASLSMDTETVCRTVPGAKVSTPLVAAKSPGAFAVPSEVA